MAVDEAMLDRYASEAPPRAPTLRLYSWAPATLSLGARQKERGDGAWLRNNGVGLVRRPTGGSAVLHEHERTFAVVGSLRQEPFPGGVLDTYRRIAEALLHALRTLGIEASASDGASAGPATVACFGRPSAHEIAIAGRKAIGSAQMRRRGAFLQHGSILLRADAARLGNALGTSVDPERLTGLHDRDGRGVDTVELDRALVAGFAVELSADLVPGDLTTEERERATRLRCWKYDSASWTLDGRIGERESSWGPV